MINEQLKKRLKKGHRTAVVVDAAERERKTQRSGSLADFFKASPLGGSALTLRRSKNRLRMTGLSVFCRKSSAAKAAAARRNGRKGDRPRTRTGQITRNC